ncbi:peptidylprolyl isomerase [bacterium]|nr:peptidylprolyl isomerase [bacterium]
MNKYTKIALTCLLLGACIQLGCTKNPGDTPNQPPAKPAEQVQEQPPQEAKPAESADAEKDGQSAVKAEEAPPAIDNEPEEPKDGKMSAAQDNTPVQTEGNSMLKMSKDYRYLTPYQPNAAPKITKYTVVRFETTKGNVDMEIYPEAAPNAATRFIELVKAGFYNDIPIFRVVKHPEPFVAQFGINWRPGMIEWKDKNFNDDPCLFHLERGTLAFAKAGPNTNSTQVFINYTNTDFLQSQNFTTFGTVINDGMKVADQFESVGNPSMGLDQGALWMNGAAYLKSLPKDQQPTMIVKAYVVEEH